MTIIGSAYVEIRALDTNLRRDIDAAMKKIKDVTLNLKADVDLLPVRRKIDELRAELKADPLKLTTEVDNKKVNDSLDEARNLFRDNPLNVESNTDTSQMERSLEGVRERFRVMRTTVNADADTGRAEAQIDTLARRRTVTIVPKLDLISGDIQKALSGLTYTMLGAVPGPAVEAAIAGVLANIEQISVGAAKLATKFGSIGAEALTLGANILSLSSDIGDATRIVAAAPAAFSALAAILIGTHIAWNNFGNAMSSNAKTAAKALALLPPEAQKAALSLKELVKDITKPAQKAFWVEMGTSLQDTVKEMVPSIRDGLEKVDTGLAKMTKNVLTSFLNLKNSGGLDTLFENISKGLDNASNAVTPFFDAINTLSVTGSKYLPVFGDWLTKLADRFNTFITTADKAGKIDIWINNAVTNLKEIWSLFDSSGSIISGLSQISSMSGGRGLADMAGGMKDIAKTVNSEPFKSRLLIVLEGARIGAEALGTGFHNLFGVMGDGAGAIHGFLSLAGQIGGSFLTNLSELFKAGAGSGLVTLLIGAKKAMDDLKPTFESAGHIIENFGKLASIVIQNMVPGVNALFDVVDKAFSNLIDGMTKSIPVFNDYVAATLAVIGPPIVAVADAIGKLLSAFADLPKGIQFGIMTFALFALALSKARSLFDDYNKKVGIARKEAAEAGRDYQSLGDRLVGMGRSASSAIGGIKDSFVNVGTAAGTARDELGRSFSTIGESAKNVGRSISAGVQASLAQLKNDYNDHLRGPFETFKAGIAEGFKSVFTLPHEVSDGFARVGASISNTFKDAVGHTLNAVDTIKNGVKGAFVNLPAALKEFPKEVGRIFSDAGTAIVDGAGKMAQGVYDHSIYASKHLSDIGKGFQTSVSDIKAGATAVGDHLRAMVSPVEQAIMKAPAAMKSAVGEMAVSAAKAYNSVILAAAVSPMSAPFVTAADTVKTSFGNALSAVSSSVKTATETAKGHFSDFVTSARTSFDILSIQAGTSLSSLAVAGSINAGILKEKMSAAAGEISSRVSSAVGTVTTTLSNVAAPITSAFRGAGEDISNVVSNLKTTFSTFGSHVSNISSATGSYISMTMGQALSNLRQNFSPVGSAISEGFKGIGPAMAPALTAIRDVGEAAVVSAGKIGSTATAGLRAAAGGLLNALGGPWGLVIAGATTAIALFGQAQQEAKSDVETLSATLDQQTGAVTEASKKQQALVLNRKEKFLGLFDIGESALTDAKKIGLSSDLITKAASGDATSSEKLKKFGDDMHNAALGGADAWQKFADANGLGNVEMTDAASIMTKVETAVKSATTSLDDSQKKIIAVAQATKTSTATAEILSKNYDILAKSTSSASDKFGALKQNIELLNQTSNASAKAHNVNVSAEKEYQQSLKDTKDAIEAVAKENNGLVTNLFDVNKGFDLTSQAGRDLHTALSAQSDSILKLGTAAMDKALKSGKKLGEAQAAAITAMEPAIGSMKQSLADLGFAPAQIDAIIKEFGLVPDVVNTALNVDGDDAQKTVLRITLAAQAFAAGNYKAVLGALPDAAKQAMAEAVGKGKEYAAGDYDAVLKALDDTKGGRDGAFAAILTTTNGDYKAAIKAYLDQNSKRQTELDLEALAAKEHVSVFRAMLDTSGIPASIARPLTGVGSANGSILNEAGEGIRGFSPQKLKFFANGGVENHIAQISQGQTPYRVWSEPESGGEAYIPLSPAKRPRSLKILEEVAKMFGFSLFKQFADGGVLSGFNTGPKSSGVAGGSTSSTSVSSYTKPGSGSTPPNIILQVNPSAALDEEKVGKIAASELYWKFSTL